MATLSTPSHNTSAGALQLDGYPTLPFSKIACGKALGVLHAQMYGAEDYCPRSTRLDLGAVYHRSAHVSGVAAALSSAVAKRPPAVSKLKQLISERVLASAAVGAFMKGVQLPTVPFEPGRIDPISLPRWPEPNRQMWGATPNAGEGFGWEGEFRVRGLPDPRLIDRVSGKVAGDWACTQLASLGEQQYVRMT